MSAKILDYIARGIIVAVLVQTLFFKFSAAAESVAIFTALHAEPWGRIGSGIIELLASLLLVVPRTVIYGAGIALATMSGAIAAHIFVLGVSVAGDSGLLFGLACLVALASVTTLLIHRHELFRFIKVFVPRQS
jgi:putative oxidoreductase